jgi:hypothetical protein
MKIIKNILIGLGVVFAIFIGLAIFLFGESSEFKERNEQFVKDFTQEFSQEWTIGRVSDRTTNDFLSQISTPNGQHALMQFKTFGKLVKIEDVEMGNYSTATGSGATGVIKFKAEFENVKALVTVTVREKDGEAKVHGFHIDPLSDISRPKKINA